MYTSLQIVVWNYTIVIHLQYNKQLHVYFKEMLMMSKHDYVHYLMPLTKQEPDFGKFDEIFEAVEVFGLEVLTMRYIAAGGFAVMQLFDVVAIE